MEWNYVTLYTGLKKDDGADTIAREIANYKSEIQLIGVFARTTYNLSRLLLLYGLGLVEYTGSTVTYYG